MSDDIGIEVISSPQATLEHAQARADIGNAAAAVDAPHLEPVSGYHEHVRLVHGWDNEGGTYLLLARLADGTAAGYAEVEYPRLDNQHVAVVGIDVAPAHRALPVGDRLLERSTELARRAGKTLLVSNSWLDSYGSRFWARHGFATAQTAAQRRVTMADLDWPQLDALLEQSTAASDEYDLIELSTPAPEEWLPRLLDLHRSMNDAPIGDLEVEDEVWTPERYRGWEQAMANRGIELVQLVARRRADGAFGGYTVVAVEHERPHLGFQEDTGVVGEHRGHRLGLRLKVEMLRLLRDRYPQIVQIDTWNADSNRHMIAVNDAIGCVVVGRGQDVQRELT